MNIPVGIIVAVIALILVIKLASKILKFIFAVLLIGGVAFAIWGDQLILFLQNLIK